MASRSDYLKLHFIVFLWGFSAILGKLVSIPAVEMVLYRTILAAVGMGIVILAVKGTFHVTKTQFIKLVLIGFIVALHWVAFSDQPVSRMFLLAWWVLPLTHYGPRYLNHGSIEAV